MQWDGYLSKSFLTPCLLAMLEVDVAEELVPPGSSAVLLGGAGRPPLRPVVDWAVSAIPQRLSSIRRRHIIHRGNIVQAVPSLPRKPTWLPVSLCLRFPAEQHQHVTTFGQHSFEPNTKLGDTMHGGYTVMSRCCK